MAFYLNISVNKFRREAFTEIIKSGRNLSATIKFSFLRIRELKIF